MKKFKVRENLKILEKKLVVENFCSKFIFINNDLIYNSYKIFPIQHTYLNPFKNFSILSKGFSNYSTPYFYKGELIKVNFEHLGLSNYRYNIKSNLQIFNDFFLLKYEVNLLKSFNLLDVKTKLKVVIMMIKKKDNINKFFLNKLLEINYYKEMNKKIPRYF